MDLRPTNDDENARLRRQASSRAVSANERYPMPTCCVFQRSVSANFCVGTKQHFRPYGSVRTSNWSSMSSGRSPRKKAANNMAFPHPQARNDNSRHEVISSHMRVLRNLVKRAVNIADDRNAEDKVNRAKNPTDDALAHNYSNPATTRSKLPMNFVQPQVAPL